MLTPCSPSGRSPNDHGSWHTRHMSGLETLLQRSIDLKRREKMSTQTELPITSPGSAIAARPQSPPTHPLADLRHAAMSLPLEEIAGLLASYTERRQAFRDWLLSQLVEGVHFGVAPGCEPKSNPDPRQWKHKPGLYKAGAEFVCDLMNVRAEYEADLAASQQMGELKVDAKVEPKRFFVYKCRLISRQTGEALGEGTGARQLWEKKGDVNNSVKMAQKNAMVAAVLNTYGLSDLFTQDAPEPPLYENPTQQPDAPRASPRGQRAGKVQATDVDAVVKQWKAYLSPEGTKAQFGDWVRKTTGTTFQFEQLSVWEPHHLAAVREALDKAAGP